ncbi:hypothetical protein QFZ67_006832 [Streptomyces sp. V1I1]|nr:hypothetical protein [Streptomyces sp. V1I1]
MAVHEAVAHGRLPKCHNRLGRPPAAAARVAPKDEPASIRGAGPYGWGRVLWIEPSFFG